MEVLCLFLSHTSGFPNSLIFISDEYVFIKMHHGRAVRGAVCNTYFTRSDISFIAALCKQGRQFKAA